MELKGSSAMGWVQRMELKGSSAVGWVQRVSPGLEVSRLVLRPLLQVVRSRPL